MAALAVAHIVAEHLGGNAGVAQHPQWAPVSASDSTVVSSSSSATWRLRSLAP